MRNHSEFMEFLDQQARRYRRQLEDMFGQCDRRFVFGSIKKTVNRDNRPRTYFPNESHSNGGCVVDIHITEWPWSAVPLRSGRMAACTRKRTSFGPSSRRKSHFTRRRIGNVVSGRTGHSISDVVQKFIERETITHPQDYAVAKELVCRCMPQLISVVKKIRSLGVRIQDITADELDPCLQNVDRETIEHLCRRFPS